MKAALLACLLLPNPVYAHSWYDWKCCSEQDCRQTVLGEVERRDDGWYVVPAKTLVAWNDPRLRRSLDPLIHICLIPVKPGSDQQGTKLRCLYIPEVAG